MLQSLISIFLHEYQLCNKSLIQVVLNSIYLIKISNSSFVNEKNIIRRKYFIKNNQLSFLTNKSSTKLINTPYQ